MTLPPWQMPPEGQAAVAKDRIGAALPRIATDRCILRAPYVEDYPTYREIVTTERGRFVGGPLTEEDAWDEFLQMTASWILRGCGLWTVELQTTGEILGFVMLGHEPGDPEQELGFFFTKAAEGKGYAFEAARSARNNAFYALSWETLVSYIDPANTRAIALAAKLGAVHEPENDWDGCLTFRYPRPEFEA